MIGLAEALFDNESEWPDELAFKKGDILRVINQTPAADVADGWWFCSDHRGNRGIVPANRLKMIHTFTSTYKNRVITPRRFGGDVFLYNNNAYGGGDDDVFNHDYFRRFNVDNPVGVSVAADEDELLEEMPSSFQRMQRFWQDVNPAETLTVRRQMFADEYGKRGGNSYYPVNGRNFQKNSSTLSGRKSPPPPPPQRRHFNGLPPGSTGGIRSPDEQTKRLLPVSPLANYENPVKIVNPMYETPSVQRSLNRLVSADDYGTPQRDTMINDVTTVQRRTQTLADQLAEIRRAALNQRLRNNNNNIDYPKPYQRSVAIFNNSTGSDNGSNSDRSSSLSDSTLNSSTGWNGHTAQNHNNNNILSSFNNRIINNSPLPAVRHAAVVGRVANFGPLTSVSSATPNGTLTFQKQKSPPPPVVPTTYANGSGNGVADDSLSISSVDSKDSDYQELLAYSELPPMNSIVASGRLVSLRQNLQITVRQLCAYTTTTWRRREFLETHLADIRSMCHQTVDFLNSFVDFAAGSFVNMTRKQQQQQRNNNDDTSTKKLAHLLRPLRKSLNLLDKLKRTLDDDGWIVDKFVRDINGGNDNLDQFIAIAKQMPEDVRQAAAFIHSNSTLIFTPASSDVNETTMTTTNGNDRNQLVVEENEIDDDESEKGSLFNDYDFVEDKQTSSAIPNGVVNSSSTVNDNGLGYQRNSSSTSSFDSIELCTEDRQILKFYTPQVNNHIQYLSAAIDEFLATVEKNQPPKIFVSNSRFVVLAAHKLIYIGDNIAQCMKNRELGDKIKRNSDRLCDVLKFCVAATKHAAVQYPAILSVQTMVDSMVGVSEVAHELTLLINEIAKL